MKNFRITLLFVLINLCYACNTINKAVSPNYTRKYIGSEMPGHYYASFTDLNAVQKFEFKPAVQNNLVIKYHAILSAGTLNLEIRSSSATIFKKAISTNLQDSVTINVGGKEKYYFVVNGNHAAGTLDLLYKARK